MPDHTVCFSQACTVGRATAAAATARRKPTRSAPLSKRQQLARLMLEVGIEASAEVLEQVRSRLGPDGSVQPSAAAADPRQGELWTSPEAGEVPPRIKP